jgi:hypothetical protein
MSFYSMSFSLESSLIFLKVQKYTAFYAFPNNKGLLFLTCHIRRDRTRRSVRNEILRTIIILYIIVNSSLSDFINMSMNKYYENTIA